MLEFLRNILALLIHFLRFVIPSLKTRYQFEQQNFKLADPTWKQENRQADVCFHVSSEGELEQVMPLVEHFLNQQKLVELIFTSPSVEHRVVSLGKKHSTQLAILRMPLVSYYPMSDKKNNVKKWVSAKLLVFCRYDFYPEMMQLKKTGRVFVLANATCKNLRVDSSSLKWLYYRYCYSLMDIICAPTVVDLSFFKEFFPSAKHFEIDMRVLQIQKRLEIAGSSLNTKLPRYKILESWLTEVNRDERFVFGSFWEEECFIVEDLLNLTSLKSKIVIVPHNLSEGNIAQISFRLRKYLSAPEELMIFDGSTQAMQANVKVIVLNFKGILLELYTMFGHAFVGGGFGVSVHSVLEPYLAGCKVTCGPKIFRSTEFDVVQAASHKKFPIIIEYPDQLAEYIIKLKDHNQLELSLKQSVVFLVERQWGQMKQFLGSIDC